MRLSGTGTGNARKVASAYYEEQYWERAGAVLQSRAKAKSKSEPEHRGNTFPERVSQSLRRVEPCQPWFAITAHQKVFTETPEAALETFNEMKQQGLSRRVETVSRIEVQVEKGEYGPVDRLIAGANQMIDVDSVAG